MDYFNAVKFSFTFITIILTVGNPFFQDRPLMIAALVVGTIAVFMWGLK